MGRDADTGAGHGNDRALFLVRRHCPPALFAMFSAKKGASLRCALLRRGGSPQDQIHDVGFAVKQPQQAHPQQGARVPVPGRTARGAPHPRTVCVTVHQQGS